jgi:hypothetical protein
VWLTTTLLSGLRQICIAAVLITPVFDWCTGRSRHWASGSSGILEDDVTSLGGSVRPLYMQGEASFARR